MDQVSVMYRAGGNPDGPQGEIVRALRSVGASVKVVSGVGKFVDLVVGFRRRNDLLEVKSEDGELTDDQREFHRSWRGAPPKVVRTPLEALQAIGAIRRTE